MLKRKRNQKNIGNTNYCITQKGYVTNITTGRVLKPLKVKDRRAYTLRIDGESVRFFAHSLVAMAFLGFDPKDKTKCIRHKDGNKSNNFVQNLEIITCAKRNIESNRKAKSSKYTGVSFNKNAKQWVAYISIGGKRKLLGYFRDEELAHDAYQEHLAST